MEDRRRETVVDEVGPPLRLEAVFAQRIELCAGLVLLFGVRGETQAARPHERVAGEIGEAVEMLLGQTPVLRRALRAEPFARAVVRHRPAAEREAPVAAARAL